MESDNPEEDLFCDVGDYFLKNKKLHDVQFLVGEQEEEIKAVKSQLINQSRTWWSMLSEDSPLAEKGDIRLPDIEPEIFTLLLKHSYGGLYNLSDLSDEVVVKLCYCANKYFMTSLLSNIAARLEPKDVDSVFPALHCLTYYSLQGVEEGVKKIVQTKTKKILAHPEFLECDVDSITYICKQDSLNCDEVELWKAVVNWAKHKAEGDEEAQLRHWMAQPLQHIRLLTLGRDDLHLHVFPMQVLKKSEIADVCHNDISSMSSLCKNKCKRNMPLDQISIRKVVFDILHKVNDVGMIQDASSSFSLIVKEKNLNLRSISFRGCGYEHDFKSYRGRLYNQKTQVHLKIKVTRITDLATNTSEEEPTELRINNIDHYYFDIVSIPVNGEKGITLLANNKYNVALDFNHHFMPCLAKPECVNGHEFEHGLYYCSLSYSNNCGITPCHIMRFTYGVAED